MPGFGGSGNYDVGIGDTNGICPSRSGSGLLVYHVCASVVRHDAHFRAGRPRGAAVRRLRRAVDLVRTRGHNHCR